MVSPPTSSVAAYTLGPTVTTLSALALRAVRPAPDGGALAKLHCRTTLVDVPNACAPPGYAIKHDTFLPELWKAVARGCVTHERTVFGARGVRYGLDSGIQRDQLHGQRFNLELHNRCGGHGAGREGHSRESGFMENVGLAKLGQSTRKFERDMTDFYLLPLGAVPRLRRPGGLPGPRHCIGIASSRRRRR